MAATALAQRTAFVGAALPCAGSSQRSISARPSLAVRSQAGENEVAAKAVPRRAVAASAAAALILALSPSASRAADVPLFGIKKNSKSASDGASGPALPAGPDLSGLPEITPEVQAGIVAGAEVLAVAVVGAVVGSITSSK